MMARLVEALPAGRWLYELKFGGYWALAFKGLAGSLSHW
jgi:hypothetical protein